MHCLAAARPATAGAPTGVPTPGEMAQKPPHPEPPLRAKAAGPAVAGGGGAGGTPAERAASAADACNRSSQALRGSQSFKAPPPAHLCVHPPTASSTESLSRAAEQQWRGQQCRGQQSASSGATGFGASTQWRGQHSTTRRGHRFNSRRTRGGGGGRRAGQAGRPCVDASWELSLNVGR